MTDDWNDYLCIHPFLRDAMTARALQAAFDVGVIDTINGGPPTTGSRPAGQSEYDAIGVEWLLAVLEHGGILQSGVGGIRLTDSFRQALPFRDLMETLLSFAALVANDYFSRLPELLTSEDSFMTSAALFKFFDYSKCREVTPANCMHASQWMRLTTVLSRYEAAACARFYDFGRHSLMLDAGGNSGEFALRILERQPSLQAIVVDLPAVCEVGRRHVAGWPEAERLRFIPGDLRSGELPQAACPSPWNGLEHPVDLVTWKSVLHDWPDNAVESMLEMTYRSLPVGGRVLIFERLRWDFRSTGMPYGFLPTALFFRSYRTAEHYRTLLAKTGFANIREQRIALEVPFLLMTAERAA